MNGARAYGQLDCLELLAGSDNKKSARHGIRNLAGQVGKWKVDFTGCNDIFVSYGYLNGDSILDGIGKAAKDVVMIATYGPVGLAAAAVSRGIDMHLSPPTIAYLRVSSRPFVDDSHRYKVLNRLTLPPRDRNYMLKTIVKETLELNKDWGTHW